MKKKKLQKIWTKRHIIIYKTQLRIKVIEHHEPYQKQMGMDPGTPEG